MQQVSFSIDHPQYGTFGDTLWLEDDHTYTEADIEAMKQERFNNWVRFVEETSATPIEVA